MKKIKYLLLSFAMFFIMTTNTYAATLSIWASASTVTVGNTVTISVKVEDIAGKFSINSSDTSILSGGESSKFMDDDTYTFTFTAKKAGTVTVTVSTVDVSDYDLNVYTNSKSVTLKVVDSSSTSSGGTTADAKTYSSDNTLSSLSVDGYSIEPDFSADVTEYTLSVDETIEKITVSAKANDDNASVSGIGEINLSSGENTVEIKVTAENGNEKIYKLIVTVEDKNPITVKIGDDEYTVVKKNNDLIEILDYFEETTIQIDDQDVIAYKNSVTNITLVILKDADNVINYYIYNETSGEYSRYHYITVQGVTLQLLDGSAPDNYQKYSLDIGEETVTIYKIKKSHKVGLIYGTNVKTGNTGYYVYDETEETLCKYYDEEVKLYQSKLNEMKNYIMIFLGIFAFVVIIFIIVSLNREKKKKKRMKRI